MTRQYLKSSSVIISQVIKVNLLVSISGISLYWAGIVRLRLRGVLKVMAWGGEDVTAYHSKVCGVSGLTSRTSWPSVSPSQGWTPSLGWRSCIWCPPPRSVCCAVHGWWSWNVVGDGVTDVYCFLPQERKLCSIAHPHEVISINGPGHHSRQPLVEGVVRLHSDGPLVVKTDPAVSTETIIIVSDWRLRVTLRISQGELCPINQTSPGWRNLRRWTESAQ